jgi:hypothetical protein
MVDYYKRLLKGEGRTAALREAQKAMIANPAPSTPPTGPLSSPSEIGHLWPRKATVRAPPKITVSPQWV